MNSIELQLKYLSKLLKAINVNYAIIGGIAVSVYGEPRATFDIDVSIIFNIGDIDFFLKSAKKYGFTPLPSNIDNFVKTTAVIPMEFSKDKMFGRCDFIIAQNSLEFSAIKRARFKKLFSMRVKLITPEDLVLHKITSSRARDLEDLQGLLIRQSGRLDMDYINYWLKKVAVANKQPKLLKIFEKLLMIAPKR